MEINLNCLKDSFRPPHKLDDKECKFVWEPCEKLEELGFRKKCTQNNNASAMVVVRKKDEQGDYTHFRKCGDYRPLNAKTNLDRSKLPLIKFLFNDMKGAQIFSKLDSRSAYHEIALREADRAKQPFGTRTEYFGNGAWCHSDIKMLPHIFNAKWTHFQSRSTFARCYIDYIVIWSRNLEEHLLHPTAVFTRFRDAGLKVHPRQ